MFPLKPAVIKRLKSGRTALFLLFLAAGVVGLYFSCISFEFDTDEGRAFIKALLFSRGYNLYSSIWSDQPPLFTYLLSFLIGIFGHSVVAARLFVLLISFVGLYSLYNVIKRLCGGKAGFFSIVFLLLSSVYLRLSISVMTAVPMIAFCAFSLLIFQTAIYKKNRFLLFVSAVIFSLAMSIKLAAMLFTPFFIFILFIDERNGPFGRKIKYLLSWLLEAVILSFFFLLLPFRFNIDEFCRFLILPHIKTLPVRGADFGLILNFMKKDMFLYILGLLGTVIFWKRTKKISAGLWAIICFYVIVMMKWRPVWHHYYIWFCLPLSWLSGVMAYSFFRQIYSKTSYMKKGIALAVTAGLVFSLPARIYWIESGLREPSFYAERRLMDFLAGSKKKDNEFIITDYPMAAIKTGYIIPPELAVISYKHNINHSNIGYFLSLVDKYRPRLMLLGGEFFPRDIFKYLESSYYLAGSYFIPSHLSFLRFLAYPYPGINKSRSLSRIERIAFGEVLARLEKLLKDEENLLRGLTVRGDYLQNIPYYFDYKNCTINMAAEKDYFRRSNIQHPLSAEHYIYYVFARLLAESGCRSNCREDCSAVFMGRLRMMRQYLSRELSSLENNTPYYSPRNCKEYDLYIRK